MINKPLDLEFILRRKNIVRKVYPIFKSTLSIDSSKETNFNFFRSKLSEKIKFVRDDFEVITSEDIETKFYLEIYDTKTEKLLIKGFFFLTDCEIDYDNLILSTSLETLDEYTDILNGLDKKFNLVSLKPEITPISYEKRPLLQIYIPGQSKISCFLGGSFWEQDTVSEETNIGKLKNDYFFAECGSFKTMNIEANEYPEVNGSYGGVLKEKYVFSGSKKRKTFEGTLQRLDKKDMYISVSLKHDTKLAIGQIWYYTVFRAKLYRISNNEELFEYEKRFSGLAEDGEFDSYDFEMDKKGSAKGKAKAKFLSIPTFSRILLDADKFRGKETNVIKTNDLVAYNRNYRRAIAEEYLLMEPSIRLSNTPTEWGMNESGKYFMPPNDTDKFYPIAQSYWGSYSLWVPANLIQDYAYEGYKSLKRLNDAYSLQSVIAKLLDKIAPEITFKATTEHSKFLFSNINPITKIKNETLFITNKTNILYGEYSQPAIVGELSFKEISDLLYKCFKCCWFIENKKLRVEHISFIEGMSYDKKELNPIEVESIYNISNYKSYNFAKNYITFEKNEMPERIQFEWGDKTTEIFKGYPIEVLSNYVNKGDIDEITISNFNADLDLMLLMPEAMSRDGFAILSATDSYREDSTTKYNVEISKLTIGTTVYSANNFKLSFAYLAYIYYRYEAPANRLTINNLEVNALTTKKTKIQNLSLPYIGENLVDRKVIKTKIGTGVIDSVSFNLSSKMSKLKIRHLTY